ncbi:ribosomal protein L20 [Breznakia sp. PFB2-8]|nr:ribosomal protein L20 [Breznakia sp. PFB2-8]MDF9859599.1 ribosomal protein L20 [Breznakia sp. PH5-24]
MPRVKGGTVTRARRKKTIKLAKGYFGSKHILYRTANEQVMHSLKYAYRDRRQLKRDMRKLWISRINAAARMNGLSYSKLTCGLKWANIQINRKMLSEMAIHDEKGFTAICDAAKKALEKGPQAVKEEKAPAAKKAEAKTVDTEKKTTAKKAPAKKVAKADEEKPAAKKTTAKKADEEKKPAAKKPAAKTTAAKKAPAKKTTAKKADEEKKPAAKKAAAKTTAAKKPAAKKPAAKKTEAKDKE